MAGHSTRSLGLIVFSRAELILILCLVGCANVPDGASLEQHGFILSDQRLELPWMPVTAPESHSWCFSNLHFSGSRAMVALEFGARTPFEPRHLGGSIALDIVDPSKATIYHVAGMLEDPRSYSDGPGWKSQYFQYSHSPVNDVKVFYFPRSDADAKIGGAGEYCVSLRVVEASRIDQGRVRVVMASSWK
jgi:hypothetical protein